LFTDAGAAVESAVLCVNFTCVAFVFVSLPTRAKSRASQRQAGSLLNYELRMMNEEADEGEIITIDQSLFKIHHSLFLNL